MASKRHKRTRSKMTAPAGSTRAKGDIVEQIVAEMHMGPGVSVERNVFLPAVMDNNRSREIDILITGKVASYPIRIAIECKNESKKTGVEHIGEFADKLNDVGIPTQSGIFVSSSRYTSGALSRARSVGIRALILKKDHEDLGDAVKQAFQSVIYACLTLTNTTISNDLPGPADFSDMAFFRNDKDEICGTIMDLVWLKWINGEIPLRFGHTRFTVKLPEGWYQVIGKTRAEVYKIEVESVISGAMVTFPGNISNHTLSEILPTENGNSERISRWQVKADFPQNEGTFPVTVFQSEEELVKIVASSPGINVRIGPIL